MRGEIGRDTDGVDIHLGALRRLVRIRDTGELLDLTGTCQGIEALTIALLADLQRRGDVNLDEATHGLDQVANVAPGRGVRCDRRTDGDAAVLRDLAGDKTNTLDVEVAVFLREAELAGEV